MSGERKDAALASIAGIAVIGLLFSFPLHAIHDAVPMILWASVIACTVVGTKEPTA